MRLTLLFFAILASIASCKPLPQEDASAVKNDTVNAALDYLTVCACDDLACWDRETTSRSKESLSCARDSLGAAFPFADIVASLVEGAIAIKDAKTDVEYLQSVFKEGSTAFKVMKDLGGDCTSAYAEVSSNVLSLSAKVSSEEPKAVALYNKLTAGDVDLKAGAEFAKTGYEMGEKFVKTAAKLDVVVKCLQDVKPETPVIKEAKSTMTKAKEMVAKTGKPLAKMSFIDKLNLAQTLSKCGISIVRGGNALLQNSYCLYKDLQRVSLPTSTILRAAVGLDYSTYIEGDPSKRSGAENKGFACASDFDGGGIGRRDFVRRKDSNYVSYTPPYGNCLECCTDPNASDSVKGLTWTTQCVSSCNGQCKIKGSGPCEDSPAIPRPTAQYPVTNVPQSEHGKANQHCAAWAMTSVQNDPNPICMAVLNEDNWAARHCENHYNSDLGAVADKPEKTACVSFCEHWLLTCCLPGGEKPSQCFKPQ